MKRFMCGLLVVLCIGITYNAWAGAPDYWTHFTGVSIDQGIELTVTASDGSRSVAVTEGLNIFTNSGSAANANFILPEASTVIGIPFVFCLRFSSVTSIEPTSGDVIRYTGLSLDAGDKIIADDDGESIILVATDASTFLPVAAVGTWTDGGA